MLAAKFVAMEIREWVDGHPGLNKDQKEVFIELAERIICSYEFYRKEVSAKHDENI